MKRQVYMKGRVAGIYLPMKTKTYDLEQINKTFEYLDQEMKPQDISPLVGLTTRQIKKLRYIKRKGNELDLDILFSCIYYISSIEAAIKFRVTEEKRELKKSLPPKPKVKKDPFQREIKDYSKFEE